MRLFLFAELDFLHASYMSFLILTATAADFFSMFFKLLAPIQCLPCRFVCYKVELFMLLGLIWSGVSGLFDIKMSSIKFFDFE